MRKSILVICFLLLGSICSFSQEAELIDEFSYINCDEYLARMDMFVIVKAQENPNEKVYVLVYEGKEKQYKRKSLLPTRGLAKAKIKSMKKYISTVRGFSLNNISFVEGGFREHLTVEIWSVPNGAEPPKPTPTLKKMKYRKGKPKGFCTWCCG